MAEVQYVTFFSNASRGVATYNSAEFDAGDVDQGVLYVNVVGVGGAGTLDIAFQAKDPVSGNWSDLNVLSTLISAAGTYRIGVNTTNPTATGAPTNFIPDGTIRVQAIVAGNAVEFSVGGSFKSS